MCYNPRVSQRRPKVTSPVLKPQFLTDEHGQPVAVILSMSEFEAISEFLEDLEDAGEIEKRRATRYSPRGSHAHGEEDIAMRD